MSAMLDGCKSAGGCREVARTQLCGTAGLEGAASELAVMLVDGNLGIANVEISDQKKVKRNSELIEVGEMEVDTMVTVPTCLQVHASIQAATF